MNKRFNFLLITACWLLPVILACFFVANCGKEEPILEKPEQKAPKAVSVKLLTYNVLADQQQFGKVRNSKLLEILENSNADIIALQEVAPEFAEQLYLQEWVGKYHWHKKDGKPFVAREFIILSKYPILSYVSEKLLSIQHRNLFIITVEIEGVKTSIGTCHLESRLEDGPLRAEQLDQFFKHLNETEESFFLGDFNFGDGEQPETGRLNSEYQDPWLMLRPNEPGYTWDREKSDMALKGSFPKEKSRRIDRVLFKSKRWIPKSIKILGDKPVSDQQPHIFPSDHFGLEAVFEFKQLEIK